MSTEEDGNRRASTTIRVESGALFKIDGIVGEALCVRSVRRRRHRVRRQPD